MEYRNTLKGSINTIDVESLGKIDVVGLGKRRIYKLSYEDESRKLEFMTLKELNYYVNNNYLKNDLINIGALQNDLVMLRAYKDNLEADINFQQSLYDYIKSITIAFLSAIITVLLNDKVSFFILRIASQGLVIIFSTHLLIWENNRNNRSKFNKLKDISCVIYILEAIKEDIYAHTEKSLETKEFNFEVSNADEDIESNIYSVKVTESLEDKSK